jgi:hypothetical protein
MDGDTDPTKFAIYPFYGIESGWVWPGNMRRFRPAGPALQHHNWRCKVQRHLDLRDSRKAAGDRLRPGTGPVPALFSDRQEPGLMFEAGAPQAGMRGSWAYESTARIVDLPLRVRNPASTLRVRSTIIGRRMVGVGDKPSWLSEGGISDEGRAHPTTLAFKLTA